MAGGCPASLKRVSASYPPSWRVEWGTADGHPGLASARPGGCRRYRSGCPPHGPSFRASSNTRDCARQGTGSPREARRGPDRGLCRWGWGGEGSRPDKFRRLVLGALTGHSWGSWSIWCRHQGPGVHGMEPPGLWWLSKGSPELDPSPVGSLTRTPRPCHLDVTACPQKALWTAACGAPGPNFRPGRP